MNTETWINGRNAVAIKHRSPQKNGDFEQAQKDIARSNKYLDAFQKIAKPTLITTTMIVAGMSATSTFANPHVAHTEKVNQAHEEIRAEISPGYDHLQNMAGHSKLTIIDKNDPNLYNIIQASDIEILPDLTYHQKFQEKGLWHSMVTDIANIFKSSDEIKRDETTNVLMTDPKTYGVAQGTNQKTELGRLCFTQYGTEDYVVVNNGLAFSYKDIETKTGLAAHEVAHCQDMGLPEHAHGDMKREILADLAAALLTASHTGNWNYLDHSIGALRIMHQHDPEHASHRFLDQLKADIDLESLKPLTQKEAFVMAKQKFIYMDFHKIFDQTSKDILLNKDYHYVITDDMAWDKLPWGSADSYFHHGITNEHEFNAAMEEYGNHKLETYLNHVNYKALEDDLTIVKGFFTYLNLHAKAFDDQVMIDVAKEQIDHFNEHGYINLNEIADTLGYTLDHEARENFFGNMKTMRSVYENYQPQTNLYQGVSFKNPGSEALPIDQSAHDQFMSNLDLETPHHHNHSHGYSH